MRSSQTERYGNFYRRWTKLRWFFRFDVHFRCRRLHEVLAALDVDTSGARVLDVGFGSGHLLASFPPSCELVGAELSESAVESAQGSPEFARYARAEFQLVDDDPDSLPRGPFDIVLSSHTLEHVDDDVAALNALVQRLRHGGVLAAYVPIEEADYVEYHLRAYSMQSFTERVRQAGLDILRAEGSMYVGGHLWKLFMIPARRHWPVIGPLVDGIRQLVLWAMPYRVLRLADRLLYRLGFSPRQALVVARKPDPNAVAVRRASAGRRVAASTDRPGHQVAAGRR